MSRLKTTFFNSETYNWNRTNLAFNEFQVSHLKHHVYKPLQGAHKSMRSLVQKIHTYNPELLQQLKKELGEVENCLRDVRDYVIDVEDHLTDPNEVGPVDLNGVEQLKES